jgi:hypothetical protein
MMVVLACAHACLERTIHSVESRILVAQRRPGAWSKVAFLSYAHEKVARREKVATFFAVTSATFLAAARGAITDATNTTSLVNNGTLDLLACPGWLE